MFSPVLTLGLSSLRGFPIRLCIIKKERRLLTLYIFQCTTKIFNEKLKLESKPTKNGLQLSSYLWPKNPSYKTQFISLTFYYCASSFTQTPHS